MKVQFVDISHHQGWPLDPSALAARGVEAVIMRATYGSIRDSRVIQYNNVLRADGRLLRGFYHYFVPWHPWNEQFAAFQSVIDETGYDFRLAIDLEEMRGQSAVRVVGSRDGFLPIHSGLAAIKAMQTLSTDYSLDDMDPGIVRRINDELLSAVLSTSEGTESASGAYYNPRYVEDVHEFARALINAYPLSNGNRHLLYTNLNFWSNFFGLPSWGAWFDLWVAAWGAESPITPHPWREWSAHQFAVVPADGYGVASARLDVNRVNPSLFPGGVLEYAYGTANWDDGVRRELLRNVDSYQEVWPHPSFALERVMRANGYYPVSDETYSTVAGRRIALQVGVDATGYKRAIFWCPAGDWSRVHVAHDSVYEETQIELHGRPPVSDQWP